MKLAWRLWLLGAVVPFVAMAVGTVLAARVFSDRLHHMVDEGLLAQAGVESVSLFDRPGGRPHFHLDESPLGEGARRFAGEGAVFSADGSVAVRYPAREPMGLTDERVVPGRPGEPAVVATRTTRLGERVRTITVTVPDREGRPFALQLAASLAQVDAATETFRQVGMVITVLAGLGLVGLQTILARRLSARVGALAAHMTALREGNLAAVPPADPGGDEIAALSLVVAEATEKLRRARAAQDRLVAEAAHELRTPLGLMRTSIDLALRRRREVPELVAALEDTRREVDRLARLSTRLLDLATAGRGSWDRAPGDLAAVAHEAAESARAEAEGRGVLVQVEASGAVPASFDAAGARQAVDNLLQNAIKFSPEGGTVRVRVTQGEGAARIEVADEGPGIPPERRESVFEPFEKGKGSGAGAGLGLAIVREIARGHGGRAWVADAEVGATVVIELPVAAAGRRASA